MLNCANLKAEGNKIAFFVYDWLVLYAILRLSRHILIKELSTERNKISHKNSIRFHFQGDLKITCSCH